MFCRVLPGRYVFVVHGIVHDKPRHVNVYVNVYVNVHVNVETRRGTSLRMVRVYGTGGTVLYGVVRFVRVARMVRFVRMDE